MDYTKFYKRSYTPNGNYNLPNYDLFISAYDECERTQFPFSKIKASEKVWLLFPQYNYRKLDEIPTEDVYFKDGRRETDYFSEFVEKYNKVTLNSKKICVDSTGFLRSHLIYLITYFNFIGIREFDVLYTEPVMYTKGDETEFSTNVEVVRTVDGCSSSPVTSEEMNDVLIVCSGYDAMLFKAVASYKSSCKHKFHIIGFPSLQADMYQESMLRFYNVKDSVGNSKRKFAPAFDPFVTAQVIDDIIKGIPKITNVYLSPLSTKPQTLGMVLYYLYNKDKLGINILFPFSMNYTSGHAIGVKRTWIYTLELPGSLSMP